jgi:hypothetical protein
MIHRFLRSHRSAYPRPPIADRCLHLDPVPLSSPPCNNTNISESSDIDENTAGSGTLSDGTETSTGGNFAYDFRLFCPKF